MKEVIFGNSVQAWLLATGMVGAFMILLRLSQPKIIHWLNRWAARTPNDTDDFIVLLTKRSLLPGTYILALYMGHNYLFFTPAAEHRIRIAFLIIATYFVLRAITFAVQFMITRYLRRQDHDGSKENHARGLIPILNVMLWIAGVVFLMDNLGYNVTTVITGLGIGGIAIALAAQTILVDLFSYFVILFDKPFEIGDYIVLDDKKGTVEYVGLKTTRLRALSGEQIILSNTNLTNSRLHNFKRLHRRRIVFTLTFSTETTQEALKKIPGMVKEIIAHFPDLHFDRGHLTAMSPAYAFDFVYYVNSSDFDVYMDRQQSINLKVIDTFKHDSFKPGVMESLVMKEAGK